MKTATEELTGNALIWAVCHALKLAPVVAKTGVAYRSEHGSWVYPRYTDDSEAGVLMASEWIGVERPSNRQTPPQWRAVTDNKTAPDSMRFNPVVSAWGAISRDGCLPGSGSQSHRENCRCSRRVDGA